MGCCWGKRALKRGHPEQHTDRADVYLSGDVETPATEFHFAESASASTTDLGPGEEPLLRVKEDEIEDDLQLVINDDPLPTDIPSPILDLWSDVHRAWQHRTTTELRGRIIGSAIPVDLKFLILPPRRKHKKVGHKRLFPQRPYPTTTPAQEDPPKYRKKPKKKKQMDKKAQEKDESKDSKLEEESDREKKKMPGTTVHKRIRDKRSSDPKKKVKKSNRLEKWGKGAGKAKKSPERKPKKREKYLSSLEEPDAALKDPAPVAKPS